MDHYPPTEDEVEEIASHIVHGHKILEKMTGQTPDSSLSDLDLIQIVLNSESLKSNETYSLQSLGMLFGQIIISNNDGYDWWMIEDEYGRDPTVRYLKTSLSLNVQTTISKRVEEGETISMDELYNGLMTQAQIAIDRGLGSDA